MTEGEYKKLTRPHARALRQLLLDFEYFIADAGNLNVFSLDGRVKSFESAVEKQRRTGLEVAEMQDLAGIRLVLSTTAEVEVIVRFLRDAERRDKLKVDSDKAVKKSDGYRSRHLVLSVDSAFTHSIYPAKVELQLQTIMQHAYNFVSRAWVYKAERGLSDAWRERFVAVSDSLASIDADIADLHADVLESAAHGSETEPLTPFSYQLIVKEIFAEDVDLDTAVWNTRFLIDCHATTNGDARSFFGRSDILRLRDQMRNTQSKRARELLSGLANLPTHDFFVTFGTRFEATEKLIDGFETEMPDHGDA